MQVALYAILPVLTMAALLAVAIMYGDGAGATAAGIPFTGQTFPPMCGF
jgi:hypothetical protein